MKNEAIAKLKEEMSKHGNSYESNLGTFLIDLMENFEEFQKMVDDLPGHVLENSKDLSGAWRELKEAGSNKMFLTPTDGMRVILNYYAETPAVVEDEVVEESADQEEVTTEDAPEEEVPVEVESVEASEPVKELELFTRNAWYHDSDNDIYYAFKKGDVKPDEVINRDWKVSTKKLYDTYMENLNKVEESVEVEDDDLGDLW